MAEMIPESITTARGSTAGEKRIFRVLEQALLPDTDFVVWYEPKVAHRRPDFLIWSHTLGLLVIEAKDWHLESLKALNPNRWTLFDGDHEKIHESPVEQARSCAFHYKDLLSRAPDLCHPGGPRQGQLLFPVGYCAAFTRITRQQATAGLLKVLGTTFCLFSDDFADDSSTAEEQGRFLTQLTKAFPVRFPFSRLSSDQFRVLRALIFPEIRLSQTHLQSQSAAAALRTLDLEQERTAKSIAEGHRVLKGVAGSGKTVVLACRARYLQQLHPDWHILVVCFGIPMAQHIRHLLADSEQSPSPPVPIDVRHYHQLVTDLTGSSRKLDTESSEEWDARIGTLLAETLRSNRCTTRYNAILVDEGQDFAPEWIHSLTALLDPVTDSLLFCLDPAQNIFGRKLTYKSVGINVQGKRPVILRKSYRNTVEILALARAFSPSDTLSSNDEDEIESILTPIESDRHGDQPTILADIPPADQSTFLLDQIEHFVRSGRFSWSDIAVLYATRSSDGLIDSFAHAFRKRFGDERLLWITESRNSKLTFDGSAAAVRLCTIQSAKGMEFPVVFLLGLEALPRPSHDELCERQLAYVGLTRAQQSLFLLGHRRVGVFARLADLAAALSTASPLPSTLPGEPPRVIR